MRRRRAGEWRGLPLFTFVCGALLLSSLALISYSQQAAAAAAARTSTWTGSRTVAEVSTTQRTLRTPLPLCDNRLARRSFCSHVWATRFCCARSRLWHGHPAPPPASPPSPSSPPYDGVRPSPYISEEAMKALSKDTESVLEQAGGVFGDGWKLELWRTTGMIEDT